MTHTETTYTNRMALRAGKKGARPAEVGALTSVFEKSAIELKQKLLKCKQTIQIATLFGYCTVINCTDHITHVFVCFRCVMTKFKFVKSKK